MYCMMDGLGSLRTSGPSVQFSGVWEQPLMTDQSVQQDAICYQWFKQRLILSIYKPIIRQRSQIKEDSVEPYVLARDINL